MLKIKDLKRNQVFYGKGRSGEMHSFKVWMYPTEVNGVWTVDCTDTGDYCFTFTEEDEAILFLKEHLDDTQ